MDSVFFLLVAVAIFFLICLCSLQAKKQAGFDERFPPISDAEFVARCWPGTDPAVALKVRRILADSLCVDYGQVHPSSRLVEDLGA